MIPTPRTPTPFKNALAAQEKMHGPVKMEVRVAILLAYRKPNGLNGFKPTKIC